MSQAWGEARLGDLCRIALGRTPSRSDLRNFDPGKTSEHVWLSIADLPANGSQTDVVDSREHLSDRGAAQVPVVPKGTLLVSFKLSLGRLAYAGVDLRTNEAIAALCDLDEDRCSRAFLHWYLTYFDWNKAAENDEKLKGKTLNKAKLNSLHVPLPPIAEQQRIVAILDEVFEAIESASRCKRDQHTRVEELRAVAFHETYGTCAGVTATLAEHVHLLTGFPFKSNEYTDGARTVRLLRGDNVIQGALRWTDVKRLPLGRIREFERFQLSADDIVVAMDRPWIKGGLKQARLSNEDVPSLLVQRVARLRPKDTIRVSYLQQLISSPLFEQHVLKHAGGSGVPHISGSQLGSFTFKLPRLEDQDRLVERLAAFEGVCSRISAIAEHSTAALAELKRSVLARAFSGELTRERRAAANDNLFATPEQVANLLAVLHSHHEQIGRDKTFGRVKAQKGLHLMESVGRIELGRTPWKDVAGPNDFPHMLKAERWAKAQGFFEFVLRPDGGYDFVKLKAHRTMLGAARAATKPIEAAVQKIIDLIAVLDSRDTEVVATVHAAWNNLILDGIEPTDDAIVREARDEWHPKKLRIPEIKFRDAIKLIRRKNIVPDGSSKRVAHRQSSLL